MRARSRGSPGEGAAGRLDEKETLAAVAFVTGLATRRYRDVVLAVVCAPGGAGLTLSGLALTFPGPLGFLRVPPTGIGRRRGRGVDRARRDRLGRAAPDGTGPGRRMKP